MIDLHISILTAIYDEQTVEIPVTNQQITIIYSWRPWFYDALK